MEPKIEQNKILEPKIEILDIEHEKNLGLMQWNKFQKVKTSHNWKTKMKCVKEINNCINDRRKRSNEKFKASWK